MSQPAACSWGPPGLGEGLPQRSPAALGPRAPALEPGTKGQSPQPHGATEPRAQPRGSTKGPEREGCSTRAGEGAVSSNSPLWGAAGALWGWASHTASDASCTGGRLRGALLGEAGGCSAARGEQLGAGEDMPTRSSDMEHPSAQGQPRETSLLPARCAAACSSSAHTLPSLPTVGAPKGGFGPLPLPCTAGNTRRQASSWEGMFKWLQTPAPPAPAGAGTSRLLASS